MTGMALIMGAKISWQKLEFALETNFILPKCLF